MKPVGRGEILPVDEYARVREAFRARVFAAKAVRRVQIGTALTLLFENPLTVGYQIQEMLRAERTSREADIRHEIDTYNEILGGEGELGCTLLVEIADVAERDRKLREWWELPERIYARLEDGTLVRPRFDARQRGDGKLSAVQFLKFAVAGRVPVAVGTDLRGLEHETALEPAMRRALSNDFAGRDEATD